MSDKITAKSNGAQYKSHPEGQYVGQCVDAIDLGMKVEDFPGTPKKLVHKCALVFRTGELNDETNDYIDIAREFTVSMGDLANLRKFLEQWRGKQYTPEQIEAGVPLDKLEGNFALLTIAHKLSGNGRTYANITACVGVPKQMASAATPYTNYTRADYWETRKKEYAEGARLFRAEQGAAPADAWDDAPPPDDDQEMPF